MHKTTAKYYVIYHWCCSVVKDVIFIIAFYTRSKLDHFVVVNSVVNYVNILILQFFIFPYF